MTETFTSLLHGFGIALQPVNLLYAFLGVVIGTLVGVLPGLGPSATIALLLPVTFQLSPVAAVIMLSGICYGAMYGGSTTSILLNMPGEASSVVTCLDGYEMAKKGRAGAALGIAAFSSFFAGTLGVLGLTLLAAPLGDWALSFGPPEYFSLMIMGMTVVTYLSRRSMIKALMMVALGIILSSVGFDPMTAVPRLTFGRLELADGFALSSVIMGLFGLAEVLNNLGIIRTRIEILGGRIRGLFPNRDDWRAAFTPMARGTALGFFLGVLPGVGTIVPTFMSYALERRLSKRPERFGTGVVEGVAAPEACNNAATTAAFVPLLTLGLPSNAMTAMLLGALMIHGLTPGPMLIRESPDVFWGVVASMYVGNVMLLILNLPLVPLWVTILRIPYSYLSPVIVLFMLVGAYSLNQNTADMYVAVLFAFIGVLMKRLGYEPAPLVLAFVLGPLIETALRRSLIISDGSLLIFAQRPISAVFLLAGAVFLLAPLFTRARIAEGLSADE